MTTYGQQEVSEYSGKPKEVYTFKRDIKVWRYTSSESDIIIDGQTFEAWPIKRGPIVQTGETIRNALDINCTASLPFVQEYFKGVPSLVSTIEVMRFQDAIEEYLLVFSGNVINIDPKDGTEAVINCESLMTVILKPVLQRFYQINCPHVLYQQGPGKCNADPTAFVVSASLAGVSGVTLTSAAFASHPDGYFSGGWIDYTGGDELQRRFVRSHAGGNVIVDRPFIAIPGSASVAAYPGCDHALLGDCLNVFNNTINNGGFPYMPTKNPFTQQVM